MRWDLVQASARGDLTRVTQLVNTIRSDVTDVVSHALWTACYWGRVDILDWLMTHTSADVNYSRVTDIDIGSMTSLAIACYQGQTAVIKRLLADVTSPCDVNMVTGVRCNTALHEVIWYTQLTPLYNSCMRCDVAAVVDVVYESDVNMQDRDGWTSMHLACVNGHLDTVKVLLSAFADTSISSDDGRSLTTVCEYGGSPELADYIQQHNHLMSASDDKDSCDNITASS
jgi:ankyrin repeat protein